MILLDKPFVSDFLKETIENNHFSVVDTESSRCFNLNDSIVKIPEQEVISNYKEFPFLIYSNSENALDWVYKNLSFSELPKKIELFKDKVKFRRATSRLMPDFFYKEVLLSELDSIDYNDLPDEFVIKPVVGFFSMGVYRVSGQKVWNETKFLIQDEISRIEDLYPKAVLDTQRFIIEEYLEGEEFAIDAYFNSQGEATVLGIMKHEFSSSDDVSDRVYYTSKEIIEQYVANFEQYLNKLGEILILSNFPLHIEVRIDKKGNILPIEVNPLRFGAWCTSSDLAYHAFGYNSITHLMKQQKPDWTIILEGKEGKRYSIVILNNSTGFKPNQIKSVDYDKILMHFENPLELRKSDFKKHPHFGFIFVETRIENWKEIEDILIDDLRGYVEV